MQQDRATRQGLLRPCAPGAVARRAATNKTTGLIGRPDLVRIRMESLDQIWRDYQSALLSFIRRRVGAADLAEDILQDVFVKAHLTALSPDSICSPDDSSLYFANPTSKAINFNTVRSDLSMAFW
ncbi:MAG TPA: hypothetical protein VFY40_04870 [Blastocatellia bacterium]|nr:hypothetical protein [Blastocatellia bacterium]